VISIFKRKIRSQILTRNKKPASQRIVISAANTTEAQLGNTAPTKNN